MRRLFIALISVILILSPVEAFALALDSPAVILVEESTGRVLYSRNEHERMYPASMSKMLTALVVMDNLNLDDIIIVGREIRDMPPGFVTGLHVEGEAITVRVLLKALIIRSSNEAGRILAINVIRQREGRRNIQYDEASKRDFSALLMQKARDIGVTNSNFNNPYGRHNEFHFTTAYDMALITRAFMQNPVLAGIAAMPYFEGDGLEGRFHPEGVGRLYRLVNTNLMLPGKAHGHPYVFGARTGFTTPAGHCFAGAAYNDGLGLITVVMGGSEPERWQDTRRLLDFGFFNFSFREIARPEQIITSVRIENPRLGDEETLEIVSTAGFTALLSHEEYAAITRKIAFDPLLRVEPEDYENDPSGADDKIILRAPIEDGAIVGVVAYFTGETLLFEAPVLAARTVYERTFDSDMDFYIAMVLENIFTRRALPYWFGIVGTAFGIAGITVAIVTFRRARNFDRYKPEKRHISKYDGR
ncbi:MAG: D-alanyl-D-alanine carboxypeptidase [Defluviitaleaceae bacterium]|nr:D-alanyl-D-alanine carboxypeptidase [Defluviitaleaceae bacterium]